MLRDVSVYKYTIFNKKPVFKKLDPPMTKIKRLIGLTSKIYFLYRAQDIGKFPSNLSRKLPLVL